MTRFVIDPDVALHLAAARPALPREHGLLAPTLLRSQVLARLYAAVRRQEIDKATAAQRLDRLRALKIRLLGDRVLQRVAWDIAARLDWADTLQAEYLALTRLQADAFVTLDPDLSRIARQVVPTAPLEALLRASADEA